MLKENDIFLHMLTKHTNLEVPFSDYVKSDSFPEQISELLNTTVTLKYRNHYLTNLDLTTRAATIIKDGKLVSSRPRDDDQQLEDRVPSVYEEEEQPFDYEGDFIVLRADASEPYRMIAISTDYTKIVINSTRLVDNQYEFRTKVSEYPVQMNEYIGLQCYDQYAGEINELKAAVFRVDSTEPCYSILMEVLGSTNVVRFILGDEAMSILYDWYHTSSNDYNNMDAAEHSNPLDVTGERADVDTKGYVFTTVNGKTANALADLYKNIMNDSEIAKFRKEALEGKTIYGSN